MRKLVLLIALVCCCAAVARLKLEIGHPGAAGLNSTFDVDVLTDQEARVLVNGDMAVTPSALLNRLGLASLWVNIGQPQNLFSYYNAEYGDKYLVGIDWVASDSFLQGRNSSHVRTWVNPSPDSAFNKVVHSAIFSAGLTKTAIGPSHVAGHNRLTEVLKYRDLLVIPDVDAVPLAFTSKTFRLDSVRDLGWENAIYTSTVDSPHVRAIGLEAPGQLRVVVWDSAGPLDGGYRYRYRYLKDDTLSGEPGLESATVYPKLQDVALSLFEGQSFIPNAVVNGTDTLAMDSSLGDSAASGRGWNTVVLERKKTGGPWLVIDTIWYHSTDHIIYRDTLADSLAWPGDSSYTASVPVPGRLHNYGRHTRDWVSYTAHPTEFDSNQAERYGIAYSYYDPYTDRESPMGPTLYEDSLVVDSGGSFLTRKFFKGYTKLRERAPFIRLYRTALDGDSLVLYGVFELPANHVDFNWSGHLNEQLYAESYVIVPIWVASAYLTTGEPTAGLVFAEGSRFFTEGGDAVSRPPLLYGATLPLSDLEWFANRLWGVGDPEYKNRLYYSEPEQVGEWPPLNYLAIDEDDNDELVAISTSDNGDYMYAFKHNKIFVVAGYDPQYDLQFSLLSSRHGAVNATSVVKISPYVYMLAPDLNVYRLTQGSLDTVSTKVTRTLEGMFSNYGEAVRHARLMQFGDKLLVVNDSTHAMLAYYYNEAAWTEYLTDSTYEFINTFSFDSVDNNTGYESFNTWALVDLTHPNMKSLAVYEAAFRGVDSVERAGFTLDANPYYFAYVYQTPFVGDGEAFYEINEVGFTAQISDTHTVRLTVYNEADDSLASTTVTLYPTAARLNHYLSGFGPNVGSYLGVRFACDSCPVPLTITDVTVQYRRAGNAPVR